MIALGDDCAASGNGAAAALQYYRRAQNAARILPDIAYNPVICLRMAQYETRYLSRKKALNQLAEAVQGFTLLAADCEPDAERCLREANALIRELLAPDPQK